jgi:hypothetical protein
LVDVDHGEVILFLFLLVSHERSSIIWLREESKGFQSAFQVRVNPMTIEVEIWQSIGVQFTLLTEPDAATLAIEFDGIDGIEAGELLIEFVDDVFHGAVILSLFLSAIDDELDRLDCVRFPPVTTGIRVEVHACGKVHSLPLHSVGEVFHRNAAGFWELGHCFFYCCVVVVHGIGWCESILSLFLSEHRPCEIMGIRAGEGLLPLAADADCQGERLALVATEADVCVWFHGSGILSLFLLFVFVVFVLFFDEVIAFHHVLHIGFRHV